MIVFSSSVQLPEGCHHWLVLMNIILDISHSYQPYLSIAHDIAIIKNFAPILGYQVIDETDDDDLQRLILVFDDPNKELLFRLKYL